MASCYGWHPKPRAFSLRIWDSGPRRVCVWELRAVIQRPLVHPSKPGSLWSPEGPPSHGSSSGLSQAAEEQSVTRRAISDRGAAPSDAQGPYSCWHGSGSSCIAATQPHAPHSGLYMEYQCSQPSFNFDVPSSHQWILNLIEIQK